MRSGPRASFMTNIAELQQVMRAFRANVLVVGNSSAAHRAEILHTITCQSGRDVFHAQRRSKLVLPSHGEIIVVLDEVCHLSREDQERLLEWLIRHDGQLVSFASCAPYAMVRQGSLVERLYYHLNTFCIVLEEE